MYVVKLTDLEPEWTKWINDRESRRVETMAEADGIWFLCPKCFQTNGGAVGTHMVLCWKPSVPQTTSPKPGRWEMTGTCFDDLTLSPSVHLAGEGCGWHGFIRDGEATV